MFPHSHGTQYVRVELSTRDIKRWREGDSAVVRAAERMALIQGLQSNLPEYIIGGTNDVPMLASGFIQDLQKQYPDVTKDSLA